MPLSLGNIILLKEKGGMRESIPRWVDKKSRVPKDERRVWSSQGGEKDKFFYFFKPRADDYTTEQLILLKDMFVLNLCTNDFIATMYPA